MSRARHNAWMVALPALLFGCGGSEGNGGAMGGAGGGGAGGNTGGSMAGADSGGVSGGTSVADAAHGGTAAMLDAAGNDVARGDGDGFGGVVVGQDASVSDAQSSDAENGVSYLGCTYGGAIDRLVVAKRDALRDLCFNLVLDFPGQAPAGLTLPAGFGLQGAGVAPTWACPSRSFAAVGATGITGTVEGMGTGVAGHPAALRVDVTLTFAGDAALPATERMNVESVDVQPACPVPVCTPGMDQTCNDNPAISSLHGHCTDAATCVCSAAGMNPNTGRCL